MKIPSVQKEYDINLFFQNPIILWANCRHTSVPIYKNICILYILLSLYLHTKEILISPLCKNMAIPKTTFMFH